MTSAMGSISQNSQRQLKYCSTKPETVGPSAGAREMTTDERPITWPRRSTGTITRVVVVSNGSMIAVPHAWTTRATMRNQKLTASAPSSVPRQNRLIESRNTARVGSRSWRNPVVGMTTAMVSMKPVVTHCTVVALTCRSFISVGSATDMIVSLRMTTNAASSRVQMMSRSVRRSRVTTPCSSISPTVSRIRATGRRAGDWSSYRAVGASGNRFRRQRDTRAVSRWRRRPG